MKSPTSVISLSLLCLYLALNTGCGGDSSTDGQSLASGSSGSGSLQPPPSATHFSVFPASGSVVSGNALSVTAQALDASNKLVSSVSGTLQVSSTDANAVLPGPQSLSGGKATFLITFHTSGNQTISVDSGSISGSSPVITVSTSGLTITSGAPPSGTVGTRYDFSSHPRCVKWNPPPPVFCLKWEWITQDGFPLKATGTGLVWSWSAQPGSSLPSGLGITDGFIRGTPLRVGTYAVRVSVTDALSERASAAYVLTIARPAPPTIAALPGPQGATINQPFTYTFAVTGYDVTVSASGTLPSGLAAVTAAGVVAGKPTIAGTFPIVVKAVDGVGQSVTQDFSIQVFHDGFGLTGPMSLERAVHTATLLSDGQVLIAGGYGGQSQALASAEIFDPSTQRFSSTASMIVARALHSATLLCDLSAASCGNRKVLIAGGLGDAGTLSSAELFDPSGGMFKSTGGMSTARASHTATRLQNGDVLITGGNLDGPGTPIAVTEVFNPSHGTFRISGKLITPRTYHTATLLTNGKVLITGGLDGSNQDSTAGALATAELYDASTGAFTATGRMISARVYHTATLLADGKVLIAGGKDTTGNTLQTAELYDPSSGTFRATGRLVRQRFDHRAAPLPNGLVLLAGGYYDLDGSVPLLHAELYDPRSGTFAETGGLQLPHDAFAMTTLANGHVLLTGGDLVSPPSTLAELYE